MIPLIDKDIKAGLYSINEMGQVYSLAKKGYLIPRPDKDGYLCVQLQRASGGRNNRICKRIATLMINTFIGPPPAEMFDPTINHIDGDRTNNHISNLEWMERGLNSSIRANKGTGILNHEAKLNDEQVLEICQLLINTNLTLSEIANKFNVTKSTINNIKRKSTWTSLTQNYDFSCRKTVRNSKGQFEVINTKFLMDGGA